MLLRRSFGTTDVPRTSRRVEKAVGKQAAALQMNRTLLILRKPPSVALKPSGRNAVALVIAKRTG